jgi:hypothetical protein
MLVVVVKVFVDMDEFKIIVIGGVHKVGDMVIEASDYLYTITGFESGF